MRAVYKPVLSIAAAALLALSTGCQPKAPAMTPEEIQRVEDFTSSMTTRCVGRYLIDLPQSFVLYSESNTEIEGIKIQVQPMDKQLFELTLAEQLSELERTKFHGSRRDLPFVRKISQIPGPALGVLIDRAEGQDTSRLSRRLEISAWRDGFEITAFVDATDNSFPEHANDSIAKQLGNDTPEKLAHLLEVYERISGRKDTEIPTEQGVCFANGFLKGPPTDEEVVMVRHILSNTPDVGATFHSLSNITEDTELLDRGAAIEANLKERSGRTLRKGKSLAQIPGAQEWLMTMKGRDSDLMWQKMTLEANSKIGAAATPVVIFDLNAGGGYRTQPKSNEEAATRPPLTKNTFTEAESLAIWDKVTATLRPRPGAF